jgi:hypothetical protein
MLPPSLLAGVGRRGAGIVRELGLARERNARAHRRRGGRPGLKNQMRRYFFLRAPDRFAALKEMPARMAFC